METHSKHFFSVVHNVINDGCDLILVADSFSTPENIGSLIRLAANVNASKVIVIGSDECRTSKIKKTAGAAIGHVEVEFIQKENFEVEEGYLLVALETVEGALNIYDEHLPSKMMLVLGNEKYGVSEDILSKCNSVIYIPMVGEIKSMNVAAAAAVSAFEWLRQNMMK